MRRLYQMTLVCLLGITAPALAPAQENAAEPEQAAEADEGVICRRVIVTGSHRRVRVCTTQAERDAARDASREFMQDNVRVPGGQQAGG